MIRHYTLQGGRVEGPGNNFQVNLDDRVRITSEGAAWGEGGADGVCKLLFLVCLAVYFGPFLSGTHLALV